MQKSGAKDEFRQTLSRIAQSEYAYVWYVCPKCDLGI